MHDEAMQRMMLRDGNDAQLAWLDPSLTLYYEQADVYIRVGASSNTRAMTTIPGKRMQQERAAQRSWLDTRLGRAAAGTFKWVGTQIPCQAAAQEANMSLEEYEAFVYGATFCDQEDPAGEWCKLSVMQQKKVDWLKGKKHVKAQGPNVDLELSVEGRTLSTATATRICPAARFSPDRWSNP